MTAPALGSPCSWSFGRWSRGFDSRQGLPLSIRGETWHPSAVSGMPDERLETAASASVVLRCKSPSPRLVAGAMVFVDLTSKGRSPRMILFLTGLAACWVLLSGRESLTGG